jgi:hypothetical protein
VCPREGGGVPTFKINFVMPDDPMREIFEITLQAADHLDARQKLKKQNPDANILAVTQVWIVESVES